MAQQPVLRLNPQHEQNFQMMLGRNVPVNKIRFIATKYNPGSGMYELGVTQDVDKSITVVQFLMGYNARGIRLICPTGLTVKGQGPFYSIEYGEDGLCYFFSGYFDQKAQRRSEFITDTFTKYERPVVLPAKQQQVDDGPNLDARDRQLITSSEARGDTLLTSLLAFQGGQHVHTAELRENNPMTKDLEFLMNTVDARVNPQEGNVNAPDINTVAKLLKCPLLKEARKNWAVAGNEECTSQIPANIWRDLITLMQNDSDNTSKARLRRFNTKLAELRKREVQEGVPDGETPVERELRILLTSYNVARDEIPEDFEEGHNKLLVWRQTFFKGFMLLRLISKAKLVKTA
jgi:hypothetical protein